MASGKFKETSSKDRCFTTSIFLNGERNLGAGRRRRCAHGREKSNSRNGRRADFLSADTFSGTPQTTLVEPRSPQLASAQQLRRFSARHRPFELIKDGHCGSQAPRLHQLLRRFRLRCVLSSGSLGAVPSHHRRKGTFPVLVGEILTSPVFPDLVAQHKYTAKAASIYNSAKEKSVLKVRLFAPALVA